MEIHKMEIEKWNFINGNLEMNEYGMSMKQDWNDISMDSGYEKDCSGIAAGLGWNWIGIRLRSD